MNDQETRPPSRSQDRDYRASVASVRASEPRPRWSVMVATFEHGTYLETALRSVLQQDPGTECMQIAVVDDHSTRHDPESLVQQLGPDRIEFVRQERNLGVVGNLTDCLQRARGELVHLLHGDDYILPGFYERLGTALDEHPEVGAAYCRHVYVDEQGVEFDVAPADPERSGVLPDAVRFLGCEQRIMTPAMVVRRSVYEQVGGFDRRLKCAEDWEMWMRIALRHPIYYASEPLACYRMHGDSNTGRNIRSAHDLDHTRLAIELFTREMPPDVAREVRRTAFSKYARSAREMARRLRATQDYEAVRAQLSVARKLDPSIRGLIRSLGIWWGIGR